MIDPLDEAPPHLTWPSGRPRLGKGGLMQIMGFQQVENCAVHGAARRAEVHAVAEAE